jgi:hypothetical protein
MRRRDLLVSLLPRVYLTAAEELPGGPPGGGVVKWKVIVPA